MLLSGCTILEPPPLDQDRINSLSPAHEIPNVPFFPQVSDQCGPASLATVMSYRGAQVSSESLRDAVYLPGRQGSLQVELVARARREGFLVYPLKRSLTDLLREVQADNPVLVLQNLRFESWPQWHYAVVIGYNLPNSTITLRSGKLLRYEVDMALFEQTWRRGSRWGIVVTDPDQLPVTADEAVFMTAVHDLEQLGELGAAKAGYQAALRRWPNSQAALFGLGNLAYRERNYSLSTAYFYQLAMTSPSFFPGWNNLAYALLSSGCKAQAIAVAQCAVSVSGGQADAQATLEEIHSNTAGHHDRPEPTGHCPAIRCSVSD